MTLMNCVYIIFILFSQYVSGSDLHNLKSSLTFVIDDTGSMSDDIDEVKLGANAIFDTVLSHNESQIENFILVTFNDWGYGNKGVKVRANTKNRDVFKNSLSAIDVDGGGDCPEYAIAGIKQALEESLPRSELYVFTDASAKDYEEFEEVKGLAQTMQSRIVFVLTGKCGTSASPDYRVYHKIASATDGEVFHLRKNEVGRILEYVKKTITGRRTTLTTKTLSPGVHNITFNADVIMGEVTLSLSSVGVDNPSVDITAPDGSDVWKKILFETDQIKVYSVDITMPGAHTVKIENKEETRAKVSAKSGIDFQHGFSKFKLSTIVDTSSRPAPGVKSHLSIKLNEGNVELKAVQILDMDDKVKLELPLEIVSNKTKFYTTKAFDPPTTMFKIMIIGYDPKSKSKVSREGLTPIEPQKIPTGAIIKNKSPAVIIEGENDIIVEYDQQLQLVCKAIGYPQPNVVWRNKNTDAVFPGETSVAELPYDYLNVLNITLHENTTLECEATNYLGSDVKEVTVMISKKFNVLKTPQHIKLEYGREGKIECIVDAYPPADITWYKNGVQLKPGDNIEMSSNRSIVTIKHVKRSDKGKYICEVRNADKRELVSKRVSVIGFEAPVIDRRTPMNITVKRDFSVELECRILKGLPRPRVSWGHIVGELPSEMVEKSEWDNKDIVTVVKANKHDSGKYICKAENEISSDSIEINLFVEYSPSIEKTEKLIEARTGTEVYLPCAVDGGPEPEVMWSKNGVSIANNDRMQIFRDHTLKFVARSSDSGIYTCTATNRLGSVSKKIKVEIIGPVYINTPTESKVSAIKGGWLELPCEASGNPEPKIHWVYHSFNSSSLSTRTIAARLNGELQLEDIQVNDEGFYTCVASNTGGSVNITYEVHVYDSAKILNKRDKNRLEAVEGDRALRITCEVSGNPRPDITWTKDGLNLAAGSTYYIESGTLIIRNVPRDAQGRYECYADNFVGSDDAEFIVTVHKYPKSNDVPTSVVTVEQGKPVEIKCILPYKPIDQLRWYKGGKLIHSGELTLANASLADAGLYTCRVGDFFKSKSGTVTVSVGAPPKFTSEEDEDVEMVEGMTLVCENDGVPKPDVTWYRDGRKIDWTESYFYFADSGNSPGQYRCDVHNTFGNISRIFNVTPKDCFVRMDKLTKLQPLMLSSSLNWPKVEYSDKFMILSKKEWFVLFCPNRFKQFPRQYITAFCEGGMNILVNGKQYDYSDIQCTEEVKHIVQRTGKKCFPGNTEKIIITYKELLKFGKRNAYEVCWDKTKEVPIYANHTMQSSLSDNDYESNWSDGDKLRLNYTEAYNCNEQSNTISAWLGRWFHNDDKCCFSRRQLVNPNDMFPGIPQKATYSYFNVVPHWSSCNTDNWEEMERRVRNFVRNSYSDLLVWTGTAKELALPSYSGSSTKFFTDRRGNQQPVPMFLWKVIQDTASRRSLAIVQINVPDLQPSEVSKYTLCEDVCESIDWMQNPDWHDVKRGYTYCCSLQEFETKFWFRGIFEPDMAALLKSDAFLLPESSLTV